jgi:hypothetical protein
MLPKSEQEEASWKRYATDKFGKLLYMMQLGNKASDDLPANVGACKVLRPKVSELQALDIYSIPDTDRAEIDINRLYNDLHLEELINAGIDGHRSMSPRCVGRLRFDGKTRRQIGVCNKTALTCEDCGFNTGLHKLYKEVQSRLGTNRGPKAAAPNMALVVGLMTAGVGPTGIRNILLHLGMPVPALTTLQSLSYQVSRAITKLNEEDMRERREDLQNAATTSGVDIAAEADARYNNPLTSGGGRTPFQPATQSVYTVCENVTQNKEIIGLNVKNKLCKTGQIMRKRGQPVTCPNHPKCTANIPMDKSIGDEFTWCKETFEEMGKDTDPLKFKYLTTDLDSRAGEALKAVQQSDNVDSENLKCTRHLSQSQRRRVGNTKFSQNMFPGKAADRESIQRQLSYNIARRCTKEFNVCFNIHGGNLNKIKRKLTYVTDAIVECYKGNHTLCKRHSYACHGTKKNTWATKFIPQGKCLKITAKDEELLREIIGIRLGTKAVNVTKLNTNTQKCESVNRAFSRTNPKNITWSRTVYGRLHTAGHMLNCGFGNSTILRLEAVGAPLTKGTSVIKQLKAVERRTSYFKNYKKTIKYRQSRARSRNFLYKLHRNLASVNKNKDTGYKRDCQLVKLCKPMMDHSYAKRT